MSAEEKREDSEMSVTGERIFAFIQRIERLDSEVDDLKEDIKEVYGEAKATGFDTKVIRKIIKLRKMDAQKRKEEEELEELYKAAIGMM